MESNQAQNNLLDLAFQGKNKLYGAYYLRKTYARRLIQSMIVVVALTVFSIASYFIDASVAKKNKIVEVKTVELSEIEDIPQDIPPPPPPPKQEAPKIEVKKFTEIKLEKKENLKPEDIPDIDVNEIDMDVQIGVENVEGIKSTDLKVDQGDEDVVFTKVEIRAEPAGGRKGWARYLRRNLNPSVGSDNGAPAGRYRVLVRFIVERDGSLTGIKTVGKKHGYGMEQEAIRVIKESDAWTPGQQNGRYVRSYFSQPITFQVQVD